MPVLGSACTFEDGKAFLENIEAFPDTVARFPQPCTLAMNDVSTEPVRVQLEDRELQVTWSAERMSIDHDHNRFILEIAEFHADADGNAAYRSGDVTTSHPLLQAASLRISIPDSRNPGRVDRIELKGLHGKVNDRTVVTAAGVEVFVPSCFQTGDPCPAATLETRDLNVDAAATLSYPTLPELPAGLQPWNISGNIRLPAPGTLGHLDLTILAKGLGQLDVSSKLADPDCVGCMPLVNDSSLQIRVPDRQLAAALIDLAFTRLQLPRFLSRLSGLAVDILTSQDGLNLRFARKEPAPIREALLSATVDAVVNGGHD